MLATLTQNASLYDPAITASHILVILPKMERLQKKYTIPGDDILKKLLKRRNLKISKLNETPISGNLENGTLCSWVMVDTGATIFEQQTVIRKALQLLLTENPEALHLAIYGNDNQRHHFSEISVYTAWVNGAALPVRKQKPERTSLSHIFLHGYQDSENFTLQRALAEGNLLARGLTVLPSNELTPKTYCEQIKKLAKNECWDYEAYPLSKLRKMGAGAFVAVAQGSDSEDAAIIHLHFSGSGSGKKDQKKHIALVGKGICFDTGGHNLKPSRYMLGMHEDMNGSAVALGILLAATRADMPLEIDCWLAIAQNHIGPHAYKQNDVITALNGLTIEIIHTDAEGRMVLADTLTLAEKQKPDVIIDFATLTGSMQTALGSHYSGIFCNQENLAQKAITAGNRSGERVCIFPMDADYDKHLDSDIADVKQCTLGGECDHILAARFLNRFVNDIPWIHMDLSASSHKDGLGAVGSDVTGFGVGWAVELLKQQN